MIHNRAVWRTAFSLTLVLGACGDDLPALGTSSDPVSSARSTARPAAAGTITLITGDRVTLRSVPGSQTDHVVPQVQPGPGRSRIAFSIQETKGEVSVIPHDVAALVASGQLDPALFNVTRLVADGFGDDKRSDLPLVITGQRDVAAFGRQAAAVGLTIDRALPSLHVVAVRQDKSSPGPVLASLGAPAPAIGRANAPTTSAASTTKIWLDRHYKPVLDRSVAQVGGPAVHARGLTGAGVTVAVLDTGIDATHPDLAGKIVAAESFVDDDLGTSDVVGHATHVASIIAGTGAASQGQFRGVAPDAALIIGRVCQGLFCPLSAILGGMEWAVVAQGARIVNLSIGGTDTPEEDPLEAAINQLSAERGALFVVSAGNAGFRPGNIDSPGSAEAALTVGAVERDDQRAVFSGQGPRVGDHGLKPDLMAPGVGIVAAKAAGAIIGEPVGDSYLQLDGTSMAAPHVTGAAALLLQQHPDWTGAQIKAALLGAASPNPALGAFEQGAGRLDLDRATQQGVLATPASLSLGLATFPHDDDPILRRTVRYDNTGAQAVVLSLSATLTGPDGNASPAGSIAVAPSTLTVPAGGSAEVVVTVDTSKPGPNGLYGGALTATGDGVRVVTPLGVDREIEAYDLTLSVLDAGGDPVPAVVLLLGARDPGTTAGEVQLFGFITEPITLHLPRGRYMVHTFDFNNSAVLVAPRFALTSNSELVMDGRRAEPLDVDVVGQDLAVAALSWTFSDNQNLFVMSVVAPFAIPAGQIGPDAPPGEVSATASATLAQTDESTSPGALFNVARLEVNQFFTGWKQTLRSRDFATVRASYAGAEGTAFVKSAGAIPPDNSSLTLLGVGHVGPLERTEHFFGPGFQWVTALDQVVSLEFPRPVAGLNEIRTYRAGRTTTESWNRAPFGPAFAGIQRGNFGVIGSPQRQGDLVIVQPSLFSDQGSPARGAFTDIVSSHARLLRNGEVIQEIDGLISPFPTFTAPPESAEYRLEQEVTRSSEVFDLSTQVSAAWTFRSQHAEGEFEILAIPALRFAPALDEHNQTRARTLVLPVHVERVAGAPTPRIARVRVDASFDDGASWVRVPLLVLGDDAFGLVVHPPGATHVSLRGSAADVAGNQVEQTIIRAYGIAPR